MFLFIQLFVILMIIFRKVFAISFLVIIAYALFLFMNFLIIHLFKLKNESLMNFFHEEAYLFVVIGLFISVLLSSLLI